MSSNFPQFSAAVHARFVAMAANELFVVNIDGDALYAAYQAAFPAGTNEVFRTQREHECTCCRNFIRNVGNVVGFDAKGKIITVWDDYSKLQEPYKTVGKAMRDMVSIAPITSIFRCEMPTYGVQQNIEPASDKNNSTQLLWNHFYTGRIPARFYVADKAATQIGEANAKVQVFQRGMKEITKEAMETVHGLLTTKDALYRGSEFAFSFGQFMGMQSKYNSLKTQAEKDAYIWQNFNERAATLRNTAFGTLLIDLSEGMELEAAVKRYEVVMAPQNYKRPVALITPKMVEDATKLIEELGIEDSLQRRFATVNDLSVNDILFVDNAVRGKMKDGSVKGLLMDVATAQNAPTSAAGKAEDITIDQFMATVLPKAKSMALLVKNEHQPNFVSLTAPVNAEAKGIFKWPNNFAWSYDGNITDSIKERVKAAGGKVDGALRVSLAWFNKDDLDLHVIEPNKHRIYFANRARASQLTGKLDVDANGGSGMMAEPVENIAWSQLHDGKYQVIVHNFSKRETSDVGFTLELDVGGKVQHFSAKKSPASGAENHALQFTIANGALTALTMGAGIEGRAFSQEKWGITTETFVKVDTMLLSPNHWGEGHGVGNKHYIFVLEGCKSDVPARGIYNEFLMPELEKHRKVFEVLGNKTMAEPTEDQLSGLGFSSTRGDTVTVQVNGQRTYNIKF